MIRSKTVFWNTKGLLSNCNFEREENSFCARRTEYYSHCVLTRLLFCLVFSACPVSIFLLFQLRLPFNTANVATTRMVHTPTPAQRDMAQSFFLVFYTTAIILLFVLPTASYAFANAERGETISVFLLRPAPFASSASEWKCRRSCSDRRGPSGKGREHRTRRHSECRWGGDSFDEDARHRCVRRHHRGREKRDRYTLPAAWNRQCRPH